MRSRSLLAPVLGASFLALSGCQLIQPVPVHTDSDAIKTAVGDAIAFRAVGGPINESDAGGHESLSLDDAVRFALSSDSGIQAALSRVRIAESEARQTRLLPNPVLNVAFRFRTSESPVIDASIGEELLSLLTQPGRMSAADKRLRAASAEAVSAVLDVIAEVKEHYASIQGLDALVPVLRERQRLNRRLLDLASARLRAGEGTKLDVTTLQAQEVELDVELSEKELERRSQRLALTRLIGRPSAEATWTVTEWRQPERQTATETEWVAAALAHRPEVAAKRWELAALGIEARLSRYALFEGTEAGVDSERDAEWSVGPSLSTPLPLFDWGQARRGKAEALKSEASHLLTQAERQVVQEARQAHADYETATSALARVRTELLPLQESRRQQAEAAYKAGQTDITSLVIADQDLQAARTKLIELQEKVSASLIRLERAAGGAKLVPKASEPATRPTTPQASSR